MSAEFLDHTKCELGEGPTYDREQDKAWWFDIVGKKLFEHDFATKTTSIFDLPFMASMLGVVDEKTQLIATDNGLYLRDTDTNDFALHLELEAENSVTRSNDGRVHPSGALWVGTMGLNAEAKAGTIYHCFQGEVTALFPDITIPNAISFSPDGDTAYFADTADGRLMQVAIDKKTALPIADPSVLYDHRGQAGGLDGAVVDAKGDIWVACWGASAVHHIGSNGALINTIKVPVTQPTCTCFVGRNLDRLLVTSAWQGKPAPADTKGDAGKTLLLDIEICGKAEPRVLL